MKTRFHRLRNLPVVKYAFRIAKAWRQYGFSAMLTVAKKRLKSVIKDKCTKASSPAGTMYACLLNKYHSGEIRGIAIIPSAFEFETVYNQRTINLSKYLSDVGYGVVYVAWQWHRAEVLEKNYQHVYKNVIQAPLYDFIETYSMLKMFAKITDKKYFVMLPAKIFYAPMFFMKENCFNIYYDIMDDWESFYEVGQAPWYIKSVEEAFVINANKVSAVSGPLVDKFSHLRREIALIGNGHFPELLGELVDSASNKVMNGRDSKVIVGYFGHLTESWFDWDLLFSLIKMKENINIEIIGYGESEATRNKIAKTHRIKHIGKISPCALRNYVSNWDVAIIPFKKSKLSQAVDPIKIYEYLYFNLPTAATGIPHLKDYPHVIVTDNQAEVFYHAIMELYKQKLSKEIDSRAITDFLYDKTWDKRFEKLLKPGLLTEICGD